MKNKREERNLKAYEYLSEKGVFDDMAPQKQIDIQEALRIASGKYSS